jgi:hypothetical protein
MPVFKYAALCFAASLVHGKAESSSGTGIRGTEERELQVCFLFSSEVIYIVMHACQLA